MSFVISSCFCFFVATTCIQATNPDHAAITASIMGIESAWNQGSGTKFAESFAEDADYVVVNGMHIKGRKAIAIGHDQIFSTIYKGSVNKATVKSIRFVKSDLAIAHVEWNLEYNAPGSSEKVKAKAMNSMTWLKTGSRWEIVSFQNTPVQAGPPSHS